MAKRNQNKNGSAPKGNGRYKGKRKGCGRDLATEPSKTGNEASQYENDLSWYSRNTQLLYDSANLAYAYPVGSKYSVSLTSSNGSKLGDGNYILPGIYTLYWHPSIGKVTSAESPVMIAAKNIYSWIRQANSGGKNYEAIDLIQYLLTMDSLYAYHAWMMRVYGTAMLSAPTIKYLPEALSNAQGVDYTDLTSNLAQLRYYINLFGTQISAMAVPDILYYNTRHRWMSSNIYMDEASTKPQLYLYNPEFLYKFVLESGPVRSGKLVPMTVATSNVTKDNLLKVSDIINKGNELLTGIMGDDDFNTMSGDILKAYTIERCVKVPYVEELYMVSPVYSSEVLEQIHNCTIVMPLSDYGVAKYSGTRDVAVSQDALNNMLTYDPTATFPNGNNVPVFMSEKVFLDSKSDIVTPGETMVNSRLTVKITATLTSDSEEQFGLDSCGSEYVVMMNEFARDTYGATWKPYVNAPLQLTCRHWFGNVMIDYSTANITSDSQLITAMNYGAADRMPLIHTVITTMQPGTTTKLTEDCLLGQKNNLTLVDGDTLARMHECALLSEFSVPIVGTH